MQRELTGYARLVSVVALALAGALGLWVVQLRDELREARQSAERLTFLEREVERLQSVAATHHAGKLEEEEKNWRVKIEQTTAEVRGLAFLEPVKYAQLKRSDIGAVVEKKIAEVYSEEDLSAAEFAYAAMGFLPKGFKMKDAYVRLLGEQIAAFYDQHEDKLFTFEGSPLAKLQNRIILAHELTHALQDQHFRLETFPLEVKDNDDLAMSVAALVEGDATLLMGQYVLHSARGFSWDILGAVFGQQMDELERSPAFLRESLLFPYVKGQEFAMALWSHGGFDRVNEAYRKLPQATSQILHPERYLREPDWKPQLVEWAPPPFQGNAPKYRNVAGEFGIGTLLKGQGLKDAVEIAAGWDGDRYAVYAVEGRPVVWWRTAWRTPEAAGHFAGAMQAVLPGLWNTAEEPSEWEVISRSETEVDLLRAPTKDMLEALRALE
jgi:hypothetical protein